MSRELVAKQETIPIPTTHEREFLDDCIFIGGDTIVEPNWAHWFFEHLLKLRIFELAGIDLSLPIVVSDRIPARFLEWGSWMLGRRLHWHRVSLLPPVRFKMVYVASAPVMTH